MHSIPSLTGSFRTPAIPQTPHEVKKLKIYPYQISNTTELSSLTTEEIKKILLFKEKAEELITIMEKSKTLTICSYSRSIDNNQTTFKSNQPEFDYISNLAMKFRFFYAEKEPTNFYAIINIIIRKTQDEMTRKHLFSIRDIYQKSMNSNGATEPLGISISNEKTIKNWFNGRLFHSDSEKREAIRNLHETVGEEPSIFQLYIAMLQCSDCIRDLYVVLSKTTEHQHIVCTPTFHNSTP
jgi:hypothetical protein